MGHTHYLYRPCRVPTDIFNKISADIKKLVDAAIARGISIKGWEGSGDPEINNDVVSFNGDESRGEDHESFVFDRVGDGFSFCKTAHKPYDVVVAAALLAIRHHWHDPAVKISVDGGAENFIDGFKFAAEVLGWDGWDKDVTIQYRDEDILMELNRVITH